MQSKEREARIRSLEEQCAALELQLQAALASAAASGAAAAGAAAPLQSQPSVEIASETWHSEEEEDEVVGQGASSPTGGLTQGAGSAGGAPHSQGSATGSSGGAGATAAVTAAAEAQLAQLRAELTAAQASLQEAQGLKGALEAAQARVSQLEQELESAKTAVAATAVTAKPAVTSPVRPPGGSGAAIMAVPGCSITLGAAASMTPVRKKRASEEGEQQEVTALRADLALLRSEVQAARSEAAAAKGDLARERDMHESVLEELQQVRVRGAWRCGAAFGVFLAVKGGHKRCSGSRQRHQGEAVGLEELQQVRREWRRGCWVGTDGVGSTCRGNAGRLPLGNLTPSAQQYPPPLSRACHRRCRAGCRLLSRRRRAWPVS